MKRVNTISGISQKKQVLLPAIFCIAAALLFMYYFASPSPVGQDLKKQTFSLLSDIRSAKKQAIIDHLETIKTQAQTIATDKQMLNFFSLIEKNPADRNLEFKIDKEYVLHYSNFYDILFIDPTGFIFHSIKKETDYRRNLFSSETANAKLSLSLQNDTGTDFVEYEYYPPSDEAAAFFVVKLTNDNRHIGWFVLQCEANRLNTILTDRKDLGRTGEVYLVNKDKLMLSESRFMGDSTILRQKVDTIAVKQALYATKGERIINDYRGVNVFSSYELFSLFGVSWIIIVEIDEDEIITQYFKKYHTFFIDEFITYLTTREHIIESPADTSALHRKKVEMNEFSKAENNFYLTTDGVSTCTAITISYPGKFGYLAHISPTDEIYIDSSLTKFFLQKNYHNFLGELLAKIRYFEIYPYELRKLQFVIIANHTNSLAKAIDGILAHNTTLANIKFMYNPDARSANITMIPPAYDPTVLWNGNAQITEHGRQVQNLGSILKQIIHYDT